MCIRDRFIGIQQAEEETLPCRLCKVRDYSDEKEKLFFPSFGIFQIIWELEFQLINQYFQNEKLVAILGNNLMITILRDAESKGFYEDFDIIINDILKPMIDDNAIREGISNLVTTKFFRYYMMLSFKEFMKHVAVKTNKNEEILRLNFRMQCLLASYKENELKIVIEDG